MSEVRLHLPAKALRTWELEPGWRACVWALASGEARWNVTHWPATARIHSGRTRHAGWFVLGKDGRATPRTRPGKLRRVPAAWLRSIAMAMEATRTKRSTAPRSVSQALFGVEPARMADNPMR